MHIRYKDGTVEVIDAIELKKPLTVRGQPVLEDARAGRCSLVCCGHPLKAKKRGETLYASALPGNEHSCSIFGLGQRPAATASAENLRVLVDVSTLAADGRGEWLIDPQAPTTEGAPGRITLAALIDRVVRGAGLEVWDPTSAPDPRSPLERMRQHAERLTVNGHPGASMITIPSMESPISRAQLVQLGSAGPGIRITLGEIESLEDQGTLRLHHLEPGIHLGPELIADLACKYRSAFLRIADPRGHRVVAAVSHRVQPESTCIGIQAGIALVTENYMPCATLVEADASQAMVNEGIAHGRPSPCGRPDVLPDFIILGCPVEIAVETNGLSSPDYIERKTRTRAKLVALERECVSWWAGLGESIALFIARLKAVIRRIKEVGPRWR